MDYVSDPYEVKISFLQHSTNPSRIFSSMSELIQTFEHLDKDLLNAFGVRIETTLLLEEVQTSSLKTILRAAITSIDDEALRDGDWKKAVGRFLLQGKYKILEFLADKKEITDRQQILALEDELNRLAEKTDIKRIPSYTPIPTRVLLYNIGHLTKALGYLQPEDKSFYIIDQHQVRLNQDFLFNQESVEDLLTKETRITKEDTTVHVKKPDYLGSSMWDIKFRGHVVAAKIEDHVWLERFQNRLEDVRPGDGLFVTLEIQVMYGFQNEEVATHFRVTKVHSIVPQAPYSKQLDL